MFGVNDAIFGNWDETSFKRDYRKLIEGYTSLKHKPEVFVMIPPPIYLDMQYKVQQKVVNQIYPKLIPEIAKEAGVDGDHVIDL